ncbi:methyltransferase domain-containing protein [Marinimicrobium sp. ABcell2]|uniref:class I SAM-dependent methyltransferase n=1 Tax=Marinimicrobium sp. ABcell2 TaxID=3069751 RepID=UPI0027B01789|nr:methyltransferase domain-containing protein [Marinimicrobium sp. ABcell2]MDQ2076424.1 methyltransferase domain-containing protein [Marinimicrobium sp. ABcell2]
MTDSDINASTVQYTNQTFYDSLWAGVRLVEPRQFNTWPVIEALAQTAPDRLEVGAGMRPRLPIQGTHFADISEPALEALAKRGGKVKVASIGELPYDDSSFDLVCALDIIEHVEDDQRALAELCRVAKPGATVLLSTPLHMDCWTEFDTLVGHYRRYEPDQLRELLDQHQLRVCQSGIYGMKPKSSWLVDWGMNQLQKNPQRALWWYNRVFMPMGLRFQKPLALQSGLMDLDALAEIFLVCELAKQ